MVNITVTPALPISIDEPVSLTIENTVNSVPTTACGPLTAVLSIAFDATVVVIPVSAATNQAAPAPANSLYVIHSNLFKYLSAPKTVTKV